MGLPRYLPGSQARKNTVTGVTAPRGMTQICITLKFQTTQILILNSRMIIFVHSWWFELDRKDSEKLLLLPGNIKGTFLVRESTGMTLTFIKSNFFTIEFTIVAVQVQLREDYACRETLRFVKGD